MCRHYVMNCPRTLAGDLRKAHAGRYGLFINAQFYFDAMYLTPVKEWVS